MRSIKQLSLTDAERRELEHGFRHGEKHCFRMRCRAVLLKSAGLSAAKVGEQTEMDVHTVLSWVRRFEKEGIKGLETRPGRGRKPIMDCTDEDAVRRAIEEDWQSVSKAKAAWEQATGKEASESDLQAFFVSIGARYKRIRKRPRGVPSPQLYEYKVEKLQELESQSGAGLIKLYYADESHTCTEGCVPYGWQFEKENVYVPSQRIARLNIFGMITRSNNYEGFTTTERMTADKIVSFLDDFSFRISKKTVIVLDNATVHRNRWIKQLRPIWEKRVSSSSSCLRILHI